MENLHAILKQYRITGLLERERGGIANIRLGEYNLIAIKVK